MSGLVGKSRRHVLSRRGSIIRLYVNFALSFHRSKASKQFVTGSQQIDINRIDGIKQYHGLNQGTTHS